MTTAAAAPVPLVRPFGASRHVALATFWFGLFFHWTPILAVLIPYQVIHLCPGTGRGRASPS